MSKMTRRTMVGAMAGSVAALRLAGAARAATPTVRYLPGSPKLSLGAFDPAAAGYSVKEYIISGTASSYRELSAPDEDGVWPVEPAGEEPYVTRIVVIRPVDSKKCHGPVVIEWLNVTAGMDSGPVWSNTRRQLVRSGAVYVAVSAQKIGIEGGKTVLGMTSPGLKTVDPARYGDLSHPGDAYSYDIFSQVAALLKSKNAGAVLGDLAPKHVVAVGSSQSAVFLTTYVNAIDPLARVYDGFFLSSRFGGTAPLDGEHMLRRGPPQFVKLREDLRVPVLVYLTETDVLGIMPGWGCYGARQADTQHLRVWEVAGTAHADIYLYKVSAVDSGTASYAVLAAAYAPTNDFFGATLAHPCCNAPQSHYVSESALMHLQCWVAAGHAPPHARPLQLAGTGEAGNPVHTVLDENGNAHGGVRSPWVDVPVARLSGSGNLGSPVALMVGLAEPYDAARLAQLYPAGKTGYLKPFEASLTAAIQSGFILPADQDEIMGVVALSFGTYG